MITTGNGIWGLSGIELRKSGASAFNHFSILNSLTVRGTLIALTLSLPLGLGLFYVLPKQWNIDAATRAQANYELLMLISLICLLLTNIPISPGECLLLQFIPWTHRHKILPGLRDFGFIKLFWIRQRILFLYSRSLSCVLLFTKKLISHWHSDGYFIFILHGCPIFDTPSLCP
jgi:hypothetical protein